MVFVVFYLVSILTCIIVVCSKEAITYPIQIEVFLSGFQLDHVNKDRLLKVLEGILPSYLHTSQDKSPALISNISVEFNLNYVVNVMDNDALESYSKMLRKGAIMEDGFDVAIEEVSNFIDNLVDSKSIKPSWFNIPILLLYSVSLPSHRIVADGNRNHCVQSVLASIAFIDISAKACDFILEKVMETSLHTSKHMRYQTPIMTHPWPFTFTTDAYSSWLPTPTSAITNFIMSRLAGVIVSCVESLATSAIIHKRMSHVSDKIVCPIIVLRNSHENESNDDDVDIDIENIRRWLAGLLPPHQELLVLSSTHLIDNHPQLSVALSSAQLNYISLVTRFNADSNRYVLESESIPYISTDILVSELDQIGDALISDLLLTTGYRADLEELSVYKRKIRRDATRASSSSSSSSSFSQGEDLSDSPGEGSDESTGGDEDSVLVWLHHLQRTYAPTHAEDLPEHSRVRAGRADPSLWSMDAHAVRHRSPLVVYPVFVLSDVHTQSRHPSSSLQPPLPLQPAHHTSTQRDQKKGNTTSSDGIPLQPLLDKDASVSVQGNVVVALHSSDPAVHVYSSLRHTWTPQSDLNDISSRIAEGLATALTGLTAPHTQLAAARDMVDITWTHGNHPFLPFGRLSDRPFSSVVSWAGRRGVVIARLHAVLGMAESAIDRASDLLKKVLDTLLILQGMDKRSAIPEAATAETRDTGTVPMGMFRPGSPLVSAIPAEFTTLLVYIEEKVTDLKLRVMELKNAISRRNAESMLALLEPLEASVHVIEQDLRRKEQDVRSSLLRCWVEFDKSQSGSSAGAVGSGTTTTAVMSTFLAKRTWQSYVFMLVMIFVAVLVLIPVAFILKGVQDLIEIKAKKVQ